MNMMRSELMTMLRSRITWGASEEAVACGVSGQTIHRFENDHDACLATTSLACR